MTKGNDTEGLFAGSRSSNTYLNLGVTTHLASKTDANAGIGWVQFVPTGIVGQTTESSVIVYVGISHTF